MNIHLKNIGIISDSNIALDGLTVITGKNSSGKTTVSKVLYSLVEATTNIELKAEIDKTNYISKKLEDVRVTLDIFRFMYQSHFIEEQKLIEDNSALNKLFDGEYYNLDYDRNEEYAHLLYEELKSFDVQELIKNGKISKTYAQLVSRTGSLEDTANSISERRQRACAILEKLFEVLKRDSNLIDYTRENINQTLRSEFSEQIQPISNPEAESTVELYDEESIYFKFKIRNNNICDSKTPVFISSPFNKVFFVDDPFILDKSRSRVMPMRNIVNMDSILDTRRILTHDMVLAKTIKSQKKTTVFEDTVIENELSEIKKQINDTIPGTFEFGSDGEYYVKNNRKLRFSNLATGSKMFSVVKILLERGLIDKNTLLIFDEPEAHLHPDWQNIFAEIIVMMVAKLNVNVLLTTHSSNFMLAIDAYMRKYRINEKCNFYQTNYLKNDFVDYNCVNENMGEIYADFMESFSIVKRLRDEYMTE